MQIQIKNRAGDISDINVDKIDILEFLQIIDQPLIVMQLSTLLCVNGLHTVNRHALLIDTHAEKSSTL